VLAATQSRIRVIWAEGEQGRPVSLRQQDSYLSGSGQAHRPPKAQHLRIELAPSRKLEKIFRVQITSDNIEMGCPGSLQKLPVQPHNFVFHLSLAQVIRVDQNGIGGRPQGRDKPLAVAAIPLLDLSF